MNSEQNNQNNDNQVLDRIDALMERFYTPQINQDNNNKVPTLTEFIGSKTQIPKNNDNDNEKISKKSNEKNNEQEFINFLNKRLYSEISGILKILIPNLTEKIYKEFLDKQK